MCTLSFVSRYIYHDPHLSAGHMQQPYNWLPNRREKLQKSKLYKCDIVQPCHTDDLVLQIGPVIFINSVDTSAKVLRQKTTILVFHQFHLDHHFQCAPFSHNGGQYFNKTRMHQQSIRKYLGCTQGNRFLYFIDKRKSQFLCTECVVNYTYIKKQTNFPE